MTESITVVIFGASGDLTVRKLIPAFFQLAGKDRLPPEIRIVGVSRSAFTDEKFRDHLAKGVQEFAPKEWEAKRWEEFSRRVFYVPGDATQRNGLDRLKSWLGDKGARRLFYLAVAPNLYPEIVTRLGEAGLNKDNEGWSRIIIEKPFGRDLSSARDLNTLLHQHFREEQIYRIDHYLGKETVQNILVFRFANTIFEPLWNNRYIDHVQITVAESVTVGQRGDYYDRSGVLRDMVQSHLLQLLAVVAMEAPARFEATPFRNEKLKLLEAIPIPSAHEAARQVVGARYAGYLEEKGVAANSRTPTFAALRLQVDNWRWQGIPFYLRSGKGLHRRFSEVVIQFLCPPHLMFALPPGTSLQCNRLALCIQPDEGIHVNFQSKSPEEGMVLRPADLEFHYRDTYADQPIPEAYERLLQDALLGDATLFMRSDEIERAWEIMDPLITAMEQPNAPPLEEYAIGSDGSLSAEEFLKRDGRSWISMCHQS